MHLIKALLVSSLTLTGAVSASTIDDGNSTSSGFSKREQVNWKESVDTIRHEFPGVYWEDAVDNCSDEEFNVLYEATRNAAKITAPRPSEYDTPGWNRYFVRSHIWTSDSKWNVKYKHIIANMGRVNHYLKNGGYVLGELKRENQLGYTCKGPSDETKNYCAASQAQAATGHGGTKGLKYPTTIFCPRFFKGKKTIDKYFEDHPKMGVASSFPSIVNELYEHTIIHESMHANVFGYSGAMPLNKETNSIMIQDVVDKIPLHNNEDQPIYGDAACHQWGWINVKGKEANDLVPNKFTMVNADSYALHFLYNRVHEHYGWSKDNGNSFKRGKDSDNEVSIADMNQVAVGDLKLDDSPPSNCHLKDPNNPLSVECDFEDSADDDNDGLENSKTDCDENNSSGLPAKVFTAGMFDHFCKSDWQKGKSMSVNYKGSDLVPRGLGARSPPVTPSNYKDAWARLEFQKANDDKCAGTCSNAFKKLAQSSCGRTGGEQSSMSKSGTIDVGCGTFKFHVSSGIKADEGDNRPDTGDPEVGVPVCSKDPKSVSYHKYVMDAGSPEKTFCKMDNLDKKMDENSDPITRDDLTSFSLKASISWVKNCKSPAALDPKQPLKPWGDSWLCEELFAAARWCRDDSVGGGYIDAGCLRYSMGVPSD